MIRYYNIRNSYLFRDTKFFKEYKINGEKIQGEKYFQEPFGNKNNK